MAEVIDWVKPLKVENSISEVDEFPNELDETEDGILAKAFGLETENYRILRNNTNNSMEFYCNDVLIAEFYGDGTIKFNGEDYAGGEANHALLKTLLHNIAANNYTEIIRVSGFINTVTVWTNISKTQKIREYSISRTGGLVTGFVSTQYDALGVVKETKTTTITRTGNLITSFTEVMS